MWFSNPQKVLDGTGKLELERVPGHVAWVLVLNCFAVVLIIKQSYNIFYWSGFPVLWGLSRLHRREYFCLLLMYNLNEISLPIAGINQTKNNSQLRGEANYIRLVQGFGILSPSESQT